VVKALLEAGASPQAQDEVLAGPLCRAWATGALGHQWCRSMSQAGGAPCISVHSTAVRSAGQPSRLCKRPRSTLRTQPRLC